MKRDHQDHYAVLGLTSSASPTEITHAYRRLMRVLHPDTRAGDTGSPDALQDVLVAYHVLGDPDRRAAYDRDHHGAPLPVHREQPAVPEPMLRVGPVRYHGPVRNSPAPPDRPRRAAR